MNNRLKDLSVMILAGGRGSRLKGVVRDRPKPMAEVSGKPFLEWLVLLLKRQSARHVIFCTGYMGIKISDFFGNGQKWKMDFEYSPETTPLGTAGAVRLALEYVRSENFLVLNGDSYCDFSAEKLLDMHSANNASATMWLVRKDNCERYGTVKVDERGNVLDFSEKSDLKTSGLINAGIYCFTRETAEVIPSGQAVSMELEILPNLAGHGLFAVQGTGPFIDIGTPESYAESEDFFAGIE